MITPIIVGYTTKLRSPATVRYDVYPPPVPNGIKLESSKEKWVEEKRPGKWDEFDEAAKSYKATGTIDRVIAVDVHNARIFDSASYAYGPDDIGPGAQFVVWLLGRYWFTTEWPVAGKPNDVTFYGFDPKPLLRVAGIDAIRDGLVTPLGLWYANDQCLDPKEMLLETKVKDMVTVQKLLRESPAGDEIKIDDDYQPGVDPLQDVRYAAELCLQYQLIRSFSETELIAVIDKGLLKGETPDEIPTKIPDDEDVEAKTEEPTLDTTPKKKTRKKVALK